MSDAKPRRTYGTVEWALWDDPVFRRLSAPAPNAQSLWLYLLTTGRRMAAPGLVIGRPAVIADDLQWDKKGLLESFGELFQAGLVKVDPEAGVTILIKALRHGDGRIRETSRPHNPNVLQSWGKRWLDIPECPLRDWWLHELQEFAKGLGGTFPQSFAKGFPESFWEGDPPSGDPFAKTVTVTVAVEVTEAVESQGVVPVSGDPSPAVSGKKKSSPREPSPPALAITDRLRDHVLRENPSAACSRGWTEARRRSWALELDKLLKRYDERQLRYAIHWLGGEQFGNASEARFVVESAASLAKKMDAIAANIRQQQRKGSGSEATTVLDAAIAAAEAAGD